MKKILAIVLALLLTLPMLCAFSANAATTVVTAMTGTPGNGGQDIDRLSDGDVETKYCTMNNTAFVDFCLDEPAVITSYALISANDQPARDPSAWTLYGSEDYENWTVLDEQSGQTFAKRHFKNAYVFENDTPYFYLRLELTANSGVDDFGFDILQLAEFLADVNPIEGDSAILVDVSTIDAPAGASGSQGADMLFDGNDGTKYCVPSQNPTIVFALETACVIDTYTITASGDWTSRAPKDWGFYGSNDGSTWTLLDERKDEICMGYGSKTAYTFENTVAYKWFKFDVTANGSNTYTQFSELTLACTKPDTFFVRQNDLTVVDATAGTSGNAVENAFDGNTESRYLCASGSVYVTVKYDVPTVINRLVLVNAKDHSERFPKNVDILGSDDGTNWTVVGEIRDAAPSSSGAYYEGRAYEFDNVEAYTYYKVDVTAVGSGSYFAVNEIGLYTVYTNNLSATVMSEGDEVTFIGSVSEAALDLEGVSINAYFTQGGELVNTKSEEFTTVFTTLRGCATTDAATAVAQGIELVEGDYIAGLTVGSIPAGEYTVTVVFTGTADGAFVIGAPVTVSLTVA